MRHSLDWQDRGLAFRMIVLAAAILLACAVAVPVAYGRGGPVGAGQAALAATACLVCFGGALAVARLLGPARALQGLLLSIALRTGAPLLFLLSVQICVGVKAYPTLVYSFLFVYLVALAIETPLSLPAKGKSVTVPLTRG